LLLLLALWIAGVGVLRSLSLIAGRLARVTALLLFTALLSLIVAAIAVLRLLLGVFAALFTRSLVAVARTLLIAAPILSLGVAGRWRPRPAIAGTLAVPFGTVGPCGAQGTLATLELRLELLAFGPWRPLAVGV